MLEWPIHSSEVSVLLRIYLLRSMLKNHFHLDEPEQFAEEEWAKIPQGTRANLVRSHSKRQLSLWVWKVTCLTINVYLIFSTNNLGFVVIILWLDLIQHISNFIQISTQFFWKQSGYVHCTGHFLAKAKGFCLISWRGLVISSKCSKITHDSTQKPRKPHKKIAGSVSHCFFLHEE